MKLISFMMKKILGQVLAQILKLYKKHEAFIFSWKGMLLISASLLILVKLW
jgi:hypothetical protein